MLLHSLIIKYGYNEQTRAKVQHVLSNALISLVNSSISVIQLDWVQRYSSTPFPLVLEKYLLSSLEYDICRPYCIHTRLNISPGRHINTTRVEFLRQVPLHSFSC
jgi:hypothetical protein